MEGMAEKGLEVVQEDSSEGASSSLPQAEGTKSTVPTDFTVTETTLSSELSLALDQSFGDNASDIVQRSVRFLDQLIAKQSIKRQQDPSKQKEASSQGQIQGQKPHSCSHASERKGFKETEEGCRCSSKHLGEQFQSIIEEMNQMKLGQTKELSSLEAELKLKSFKLKQVSGALSESEKKLQKMTLEKELGDDKLKLLTEKINNMKADSDHKICELSMQLHEKTVKLDTSEKIQEKIDQILFPEMPCSDMENLQHDENVDRILATYGYTANVPLNAKVRLQQSIDLSKRLASERDHLEKARETAEDKLREVERKYQDLLIELNKLKLSENCRSSELESELKLKKFELERLSMLFSESQDKFKSVLLQNEQLAEKLNALREDFSTRQSESDTKITKFTLKLQETSTRLEAYDKLEAELDKVVIQAAALPNNNDSDDIFSAYGYGTNIPSSSKRRLQQSLTLARRVLALEQRATEQKQDLFNTRDRNVLLTQELEAAKAAIQHAGHPTTELLNLISKRDMELYRTKDNVEDLELMLQKLKRRSLSLEEELKKAKLELEKQSTPSSKTLSRPTESQFHSFTAGSTANNKNRSVIPPCYVRASLDSSQVINIKKPLLFSKLQPEQ